MVGKHPNPKARPTHRGSQQWLMTWAIIALAIVVVVAWLVQAPPQDALRSPAKSLGTVLSAWARRETSPTLDPAEFTDKAAIAYQSAREIPEVLDQLHCYCECDRFLDHRSLLSCYVDYHAAT